jgi:hypothetical protein
MLMRQVIAQDNKSRSPHRAALKATIALVLGAFVLAGCAGVAPVGEGPPPSPFTDHGQ